jgi:membrane associated rhomboid family serine protease
VFPISDVNPTRTRPLVTFAVILLNLIVFFGWQPRSASEGVAFEYRRAAIACELTTGEALTLREIRTGSCTSEDATAPVFPQKALYVSVLVSLFLHGSLLHIAGNMWFLWIFGNNVEEAFSHLGYLALYLVCGVVATAAFVLARPDETAPLIGASGAIAGVLGAYLVLFPRHLIVSIVFITLLPIPAAIFLGLWFLGQFAITEPGVAWEAHAGGFVAGALIALALRARLLERVQLQHRGEWA